mgnify:FL=1
MYNGDVTRQVSFVTELLGAAGHIAATVSGAGVGHELLILRCPLQTLTRWRSLVLALCCRVLQSTKVLPVRPADIAYIYDRTNGE